MRSLWSKMRADAIYDVPQVGERIDAAKLTTGFQTVDDRHPFAAVVTASEQTVLASDHHHPQHLV